MEATTRINPVQTARQAYGQRALKGRPIEEYMDELAKRLGKHYGLNDIREAL